MPNSYVKRVMEMAHELGYREAEISPDVIKLTIDVEGAHAVDVFVRPVGEIHGKEVLEFSSCGVELPSDDASKMPLLILALQRNADVLLGHWGLDEAEDTTILRVFHSQITETMDLPEFRGALLAVADEYSTLAGAFPNLIFPHCHA